MSVWNYAYAKLVWAEAAIDYLDRFAAPFACANADAVVHREDKDFAVADFASGAGTTTLDNRTDRALHEMVIHRNHQLHLAKQVSHRDFVAAVDFRLPLLPTKALAIHDGQADDFDLGQRSFDVFELSRLNDGDDKFHTGYRVQDAGPLVLKYLASNIAYLAHLDAPAWAD